MFCSPEGKKIKICITDDINKNLNNRPQNNGFEIFADIDKNVKYSKPQKNEKEFEIFSDIKYDNNKIHDKNGKEITIVSEVRVPEPNDSDIHVHSFVGSVADILDNGNIIVEDRDSDFFEIESERLVIVED